MDELIFNRPKIPQIVSVSPLPSPIQAFYRYIRSKQAEKTQDGYAYDIQEFFEWNLPSDVENLRQRVTSEAVQLWVNSLIKANNKGGEGLKAVSAIRKLAALRHFLEYCVALGLLERNPAHPLLVKKPKTAPWEPKLGLTTSEIRALGDACRRDPNKIRGARDLAIISIGFSGCLRCGEIAQVSVHDIQRDRDKILLRIPRAKGGQGDSVELAQATKLSIEEYLLELGGPRVVKPDEGSSGQLRFPVFVSLSNRSRFRRLTEDAINKIVQNRAFEAEIRNMEISSHLLRHSGITHLFELGWPLGRIQRHARHEDPKTTQLYYNKWAHLKDSPANALGDVFEGKKVKRPDFELG